MRKISICKSSHKFQSLSVKSQFVRVPTVSKFIRKISICKSSHKFQSLSVKSQFVRVPTSFKV
ncbi:hypothetical protein FWJ33_10240 [Leptospira interrogans serovar Hardjo]|nr:hypothetical protein FWJ33_10240 [Leptospira interrogans serovar Hardjo]